MSAGQSLRSTLQQLQATNEAQLFDKAGHICHVHSWRQSKAAMEPSFSAAIKSELNVVVQICLAVYSIDI